MQDLSHKVYLWSLVQTEIDSLSVICNVLPLAIPVDLNRHALVIVKVFLFG